MKILSLLLALLASAGSNAQNTYWQQQVNMNIDVSLNDTMRSITGNVAMEYLNNSPDTLKFVWIHLWPNAYKNDRTAFTKQMIENGDTDFYFSDEDQKGFIDRLNFTINGRSAFTEEHPEHQDIVKVLFPESLAPGNKALIETPFHVKIPDHFSRSGYSNGMFMLTQWYPKPAVYDSRGWHPMPYLDQGEFYSEFGNYRVKITVPEKYQVLSTGTLQTTTDSAETKSMLFIRENVHDFAWFASADWMINRDTLNLGNRTIDVIIAFDSANKESWTKAAFYTKRAIRTKSEWLGEYPYDHVTIVEDKSGGGGMEYPAITIISRPESELMLDYLINHETGHNWFYSILASNERTQTWMDEGMNSYYDRKYMREFYGKEGFQIPMNSKFVERRFPEDVERTILNTFTRLDIDQPISTSSEKFTSANYNIIPYTKAALWMQKLENEMGPESFAIMMKDYYEKWKFRHPYPEDFKRVAEELSGKTLETFSLLDKTGELDQRPKRKFKVESFFSFKDTDKYSYMFVSPAIGYNHYDKLMAGVLIHNYTAPLSRLRYFITPLYATGSKTITGTGRVAYTLLQSNNGGRLDLSFAGSRFNVDEFTDSTNTKNFQPYSKLVPSARFIFANKDPRSRLTKMIQWKTFFINETSLLFKYDPLSNTSIITYPQNSRYLNQLRFIATNTRKLYPYDIQFQAEHGEGFLRFATDINYFFNYAKGGGLNVRAFAGKFVYTGDETFVNSYNTSRYHLNMSGAKGNEDYSYENYFSGRNEFEGIHSQQIMIRDGGFKVRTDLLANKIGRTDDWLTAINLTSDIPKNINPLQLLPFKIPLKFFVDIGTYAEAWEKDPTSGKFLYDAGFQVSVLKVVNIYFPFLYSKEYRDYFKSTITEKKFAKNISFSIDVQNISLKKLIPMSPF